jgi:antitoxin CptB
MSTDTKMDKRRKRLLFRCWHRGTREADILLGGFADAYVASMNDSKLNQLEQLLEQNDIDLYNWITGKFPWPANIENEITAALSTFCAEGRHR